MPGGAKPRDDASSLPGTVINKLDTAGLQPFRQGEFDSLCGLYAAINALRLALVPVRRVKRPQADALFRLGIDVLAQSGTLPTITISGINPTLLLELIEQLAAAAGITAGVRISAVQPLKHAVRATRQRMYEKIDEAIACGQPVIIGLHGMHDHWTVVAGTSPFNLWLFDSGNLQRIKRSDCGTLYGGSGWSHRINARAIIVLHVRRRQRGA